MMEEDSNQELHEESKSKKSAFAKVSLFLSFGACLFFAIFFAWYCIASQPPSSFPQDSSVRIENGQSVKSIVAMLAQKGYVKSESLLYAYIVLREDPTNIQAGVYTFSDPVSVQELTRMIVDDGPKEELVTLTFPEGYAVKEFAEIAAKALPTFSEKDFIDMALSIEGALFPDTYFVPKSFDADSLFTLLTDTHKQKLAPLQTAITEHALTEYEVLTLASIIEREANTAESMKNVSSVLQNRMAINMPLQADASIEYVLDKPLSELLASDLEIDSPYNTYLYMGLPPTPIGNPGLDAITAVLEPNETDYFYYITDDDGVFHYAETFNEHRQNIARYLR